MSDLSAKLSSLTPAVYASLQGPSAVAPAVKAEPVMEVKESQSSAANIIISHSRYSPAYGPSRPIVQVNFSNPILADDSSNNILYNATQGRVAGGVSRISELLARGDTEYEQDMRQYTTHSFPTKNGEYPPIDLEKFQERDNDSDKGLNLTLKTKDGDTIHFSLEHYQGYGVTEGETAIEENGIEVTDKRHSRFQGVKIGFSLEGQLSNEEKLQLDVLVAKLEGINTGYFDTGEFALSELDFSQFDLMSDVDLSFHRQGKEMFAFKYHDDDLQRTIEFGRAKIAIDKTSLGMSFSTEQQEQAIQEYIALIQESAKEVKAGESDLNIMLDVFQLGFKGLGLSEDEEAEKELADGSPIKAMAETGETIRNSVIPLPDFDFSFSSEKSRPNAIKQPGEYVGFDLNISLKSLVHEDSSEARMDIVQTQKFELTGAYYEPLDHLERVDFKNQNYKYTTVHRESEKVNHLLIQDGLIEKAQSSEQGEAKIHTRIYEEGELVDEMKDILAFAHYEDFTELAQKQEDRQTQDMLETLVIDPYQKYNESEETQDKMDKQAAIGDLKALIGRLKAGQSINSPSF